MWLWAVGFGTVLIDPLKQLQLMPASLVERLAKDPEASNEYFEHFTSAYNFFVGIEPLEMLKREGAEPITARSSVAVPC